MGSTVETSISIQETVFNQAEILAQHLQLSPRQLFETAIEAFIKRYQNPFEETTATPQDEKMTIQMARVHSVINQGDIYWVQLENPMGVESDIPHPYVVVQDNVFNHSRIESVVVCALTSNIKRANLPGNVLLEVSEANLPKQSVVEASKVSTVDKMQLGEYIGSLTEQRIDQILAGMRFLQTSFFAR